MVEYGSLRFKGKLIDGGEDGHTGCHAGLYEDGCQCDPRLTYGGALADDGHLPSTDVESNLIPSSPSA